MLVLWYSSKRYTVYAGIDGLPVECSGVQFVIFPGNSQVNFIEAETLEFLFRGRQEQFEFDKMEPQIVQRFGWW